MADAVSLLPAYSTSPRERAISEAVAEWCPVPVEILDTLWDPRTCPPAVLPHLARALGMPLWPERWTLSQQRSFTARWVALSRRRGVEATFAELLAQLDLTLREFLAPPQGIFPRAGRTEAERRAFREKFPEIRVYPYRNRHVTRGTMVFGQPWFGSRTILRRSVAGRFAGARATVVDGGIEREIPIRVETGAGQFAQGLFVVSLPTTKPRVSFPAILGKNFILRRSTAASRVYRYADGSSRGPDLLPPGRPFQLTPDRVRAPHTLRGGFFFGHAWPMTLRPSVAAEHVYDSVRIYDPARAVAEGPPRSGGWIMGRSKFRQPPFTLHLAVDATHRRPSSFIVGGILPMVLRPHDDSGTREASAALRAGKLGRDQVLFRTNLHRPIRVGDGLTVGGGFRVGQVIRRI